MQLISFKNCHSWDQTNFRQPKFKSLQNDLFKSLLQTSQQIVECASLYSMSHQLLKSHINSYAVTSGVQNVEICFEFQHWIFELDAGMIPPLFVGACITVGAGKTHPHSHPQSPFSSLLIPSSFLNKDTHFFVSLSLAQNSPSSSKSHFIHLSRSEILLYYS